MSKCVCRTQSANMFYCTWAPNMFYMGSKYVYMGSKYVYMGSKFVYMGSNYVYMGSKGRNTVLVIPLLARCLEWPLTKGKGGHKFNESNVQYQYCICFILKCLYVVFSENKCLSWSVRPLLSERYTVVYVYPEVSGLPMCDLRKWLSNIRKWAANIDNWVTLCTHCTVYTVGQYLLQLKFFLSTVLYTGWLCLN